MDIDIYLDKTVEKNAEIYYEQAKKAKRKLQGATEAREKTQQKLNKLLKEKETELKKFDEQQKKRIVHKKEWYEKFHWFFSSEDFLCIGGRDATSNEIVVKKHTDKNDLVLHTDMAGSPFFIIKNGQDATTKTIEEAAQATASYSKAWKAGMTTLDTFYVKPEQVTKKARSGEFMPKGAFMVYGETKYMHPLLELAIGITHDRRIIGGPLSAIKTHAEKYVLIIPGKNKTSDVGKKVAHQLDVHVDDVASFIPAGGSEVRKE